MSFFFGEAMAAERVDCFEDNLRLFNDYSRDGAHVVSFTLDRVGHYTVLFDDHGHTPYTSTFTYKNNLDQSARDVGSLCLILRGDRTIQQFVVNADLITTQRQTKDIHYFLRNNEALQSLYVIGSNEAKNRLLLAFFTVRDIYSQRGYMVQFYEDAEKIMNLVGPQDLANAIITTEESTKFMFGCISLQAHHLALFHVFHQLENKRILDPPGEKTICIDPKKGEVQMDLMNTLKSFLENPGCCARTRIIMKPDVDIHDTFFPALFGEIGWEFHGQHYQIGAPGCWTFVIANNRLDDGHVKDVRGTEDSVRPFIDNKMLQIRKIAIFRDSFCCMSYSNDIDTWEKEHWETFYKVLGSNYYQPEMNEEDGINNQQQQVPKKEHPVTGAAGNKLGNNNNRLQVLEKKYPVTGAAQKLLQALDNNATLLKIEIGTNNKYVPSLHRHAKVLQQWAQFLMWRNGFDWHGFIGTEQGRPCNQMVESAETSKMVESVQTVLDGGMSDVNKQSAIFSLMLTKPHLLKPVD